MGKQRKKKKFRINQVKLLLTVIIISLIAVVGVSIKNVFSLRQEQAQLKQTYKELRDEKAALKEELKNVNDYDYIEEQARIQLKLIKPGEVIYMFDKNGDKND